MGANKKGWRVKSNIGVNNFKLSLVRYDAIQRGQVNNFFIMNYECIPNTLEEDLMAGKVKEQSQNHH